VVPLARRYDERILLAVRALDDPAEPLAETCRRVATVAEGLGLVRPSYSHLRRVIHAERERERTEIERRAAVREVWSHVLTQVAMGRFVDPNVVEDRLARARAGGS
jgi:hypothetical protein